VTGRDDWDRLVAETLDADEAEKLATARRGSGGKKLLTDNQLRQKKRAALAYAASLSLADRRAVGQRLTEGRRIASERRRAEREAAGNPIPERPSNRRDPSMRTLAPYLEQVYRENTDESMSQLEARRLAITLYRIAREQAIGD
jgi:hypothetical protein